MNPVRYGTQGKVYGGGGRESGNGLVSSVNRMRYNKKGHIFMYNNLQGIPSRHQRRYYLCARINIIIL